MGKNIEILVTVCMYMYICMSMYIYTYIWKTKFCHILVNFIEKYKHKKLYVDLCSFSVFERI
jgi:hypothetical protein